jgi:ABC-type oligopeptide transport system ATPase subunit
VVEHVCDRVAVMYRRIVEVAGDDHRTLQPYTQAFMSAILPGT